MAELSAARPVIFGEVLFDVFPDEAMVLGGAPFNVAWHLRGFGLDPLMVSRVGNDPQGRTIRDAMLAWGMDTAGLQLDSQHPTGRVNIQLEDGEPSYDILADQAYDHIDPDLLPPLAEPYVLYHGSLALRSAGSRAAWQRLQSAAAARFVDINLREPWWQSGPVLAILQGARWVKLNQHELAALGFAGATALQQQAGIGLLVETRGAEGAVAHTAGAGDIGIRPKPVDRVVDAVGAGDAFASVLLLGLLAGWELQTTMDRAQQFASEILGVRGAVPREPTLYAALREQWGI